MTDSYDDIINLPHHVSDRYPHMPMYDRAAQFAPFAALTGHEEAINETSRYTEERIELTEEQKENIDRELQELRDRGAECNVRIVYFEPDELKKGGTYVEFRGVVKKINSRGQLTLENETILLYDNIYELEIMD